jgi:hypothetical protein
MDNIQNENAKVYSEDEFQGRLYVSFSITGKEISLEELTAKLGIQPEASLVRGTHSYWDITSENRGFPSNDPMPHFEWLIGILEPAESKIREILAEKNINARVSCFWITPDGRINLELEPDMIARFARLNLKIWFDIYCNH